MLRSCARNVGWGIASALVVVATGSTSACNALLDNQPAMLVESDASSRPSGDDDRTGAAREDATPDASGDAAASSAEDASSCNGCAPPHATPACTAGACTVASCDPGWADCNADPSDGCEADLASPSSCGACGLACPALPNAETTCAGDTCIMQCSAGFADCDKKTVDGCEVDLGSDDDNCGGCRHRCRPLNVAHCVAGTCKILL